MTGRRWILAAALATGCSAIRPPASQDIQPAVRTEQVADDPDDPAIWVHPTQPERSLILGTNKAKAPAGAVVVFGLDGKIKQTVAGLHRPNNVDVEYGLRTDGGAIDIAVVTERLRKRLRVFRVNENGIAGITGRTTLFEGRAGDAAAPMGVALYKRPKDGVIFAIVTPKSGGRVNYLGQYRLDAEADGKVNATPVREFGRFSGVGEIEAVAVDDALGYIYYADEGDGIHKYHADPDHPDAANELAHFGKTGFQADREGIAIYAREDGMGFVVCTDQIAGNSQYRFFRREGEPGRPHHHEALLGVVSGGADSTDGLEISSRYLGPRFPAGLMAAMNSSGKNFLIFRWEDVQSGLKR